jgi:hypothetical protein
MVIDSDWYRALFPAMRPARDTGFELVTTAGGGRYATTVGGTLTGRGADLIIVDDPLKAEEAMSEVSRKRVIDWYSGTLVSRLNDKLRGPIVVVMQRSLYQSRAGVRGSMRSSPEPQQSMRLLLAANVAFVTST